MKVLSKYFGLFIIVFLGIFSEQVLNTYKSIILNANISILLVTLIAGLFGFIIAVIPFAIQLFNQDNGNKKNNFLNKLMQKDKFNFFVKPMFNRFVKILYIMFSLFLYTFFLNIVQVIDVKSISFIYNEFFDVPFYKFGIVFLFYMYLVLIIDFFIMLKNIIRDLQTLVFNFFKAQEDAFKNSDNKSINDR